MTQRGKLIELESHNKVVIERENANETRADLKSGPPQLKGLISEANEMLEIQYDMSL
jgi:hypothetical protein